MHSRLRPFVATDVEFVADNMREADRAELRAGGFSPSAGLRMSVDSSTHLITGLGTDGNPAFILGAQKRPDSSAAVIWMLGTDAIDRESKLFLLNSRPTLEALWELLDVSTLYNFVWKGNAVHIKWLRWLGFNLLPRDDGPNKDFIFFYKHRE